MGRGKSIEKKYLDFVRKALMKGEKPIDIFKNMRDIYGARAPCLSTVIRYFRLIKAEIATTTSTRSGTAVEVETKLDNDLEIIFVKPETGNIVGPERILGDFVQNGQRYFLVKWKTQDENTTGA